MNDAEHVARQRAFYESGGHAHLRAETSDRYAARLAAELARQAGLGPAQRVLEIGAGFGRFTFPLLAHCGELIALDVSPRVLAELEAGRDARGIAAARCRTLCADVDRVDASALGGPVDAIVGLFILHHLPDFPQTLARLAPLLAPGGVMAFVEPNRRNPLFVAQLLCCADMHWREEKGMFTISQATIATGLRRAGLSAVTGRTFGFFPPQVINRLAAAQRFERWLEARRILAPILPFLLATARRDAAPDAAVRR